MTAFRPDLFSNPNPIWTPAIHSNTAMITSLLEFHFPEQLPLSCAPEQSGGLEINSRNLRLTGPLGHILLKRWPQTADKQRLENTLKLMDWLIGEGLPVPKPKRLSNHCFVINHAGSLWTIFSFIEGRYFSGQAGELEASADILGRLIATLRHAPKGLMTALGPKHLSDSDDDVFKRLEKSQPQWNNLFGSEHSNLLHKYWPTLQAEWLTTRKSPPAPGPPLPVHFDLHPHNLLMTDDQVMGILDFDSCARMPVGYAVGFAGLKLSRQAVVASGRPDLAKEVGHKFVQSFASAEPKLSDLAPRFTALALAEVFRRLAIIFRLNLDQFDRTWNHVLPVQLAHLKECKALFES